MADQSATSGGSPLVSVTPADAAQAGPSESRIDPGYGSKIATKAREAARAALGPDDAPDESAELAPKAKLPLASDVERVSTTSKADAPAKPEEGQESAEEPTAQGEEGAATEALQEEQPETRVSRAFLALARKKQALKAERAELVRQKTELQSHLQRWQTERQELDQLRALVRSAQSDPLAFARQVGIDYDALTKAVLAEGSPEAAAETARREIAQLKKEIELDKLKAQEASREAQQRTAQRNFISIIREHKDNYPAVSLYEDDEILEGGRRVQQELMNAGKPYELHHVARELDKRLLAHHTSLRSKLGFGDAAPQSATPEQEGPSESARPEMAKAVKPVRSVSNKLGSLSAASGTKKATPADYRQRALRELSKLGIP